MGLTSGSRLVSRAFLVVTALGAAVGLAGGGSRAAWADPPPEADRSVISIREEISIEELLRAVGRKLDAKLVWDPGTKLIKDKKVVGIDLSVPPARLFALVRSLLVPYDLVLVPMGSATERWYFVMDAKQQGAVVKLKPESIELTDDNLSRYEGEDGLFVSATIRVRALKNLRDARTALTKVTTQNLGNVTEVPDANAFVVTDFAPAVVGIYRLIRQLDVAPVESSSPGRLVTLRHARAETVARLLGAHFAPAPTPPPVPQQAGSAPFAPVGLRINADARTNQLLLGGAAADVQAALKLVEGLDMPVEAPSAASTASTSMTATVFKLRYTQAREIQNMLQGLVNQSALWMTPDGNRPAIVADGISNQLVVAAPEKATAAIRALIESLDVAPPGKEPPPAPPEPAATR